MKGSEQDGFIDVSSAGIDENGKSSRVQRGALDVSVSENMKDEKGVLAKAHVY